MRMTLAALVCLLATASAQWLETTIALPSGSTAEDLCYNSTNDMVYAVTSPGDSLFVISAASNQIVARLGMGGARVVCCDTAGNVYCADNGMDQVVVVDGASNQIWYVVDVNRPERICYSPVANKVYVACGTDSVTVISCANHHVVARLQAGYDPGGLCVNTVSNKVYVPSAGEGTVTIIGGASNTVLATVGGLDHPVWPCYNSRNDKVYVGSDSYSGPISVIDGATNQLLRTITPRGHTPCMPCYDPTENKVFVAGSDGTVTVVDGATDTVIGEIAAGGLVYSILYEAQTNKLFVPSGAGRRIDVILAPLDTLLLSVDVADVPRCMAWSPTDWRLYVGLDTAARIAVIRDTSHPGVGDVSTQPGAGSPLTALPNPARTSVQFVCPTRSHGSIVISDMAGRSVRTLRPPQATFTWDRRDESGRLAPAGIYCARVPDTTASTRFVLLP